MYKYEQVQSSEIHLSVQSVDLLSRALLEPDLFLLYPPKQPKLEVAEYVESCGVPVPRRFNTLAEALSSEKSFIIRSEHPQDYAGASGIVDSLVVSPETILIAEDRIERKASLQLGVPDHRVERDAEDTILTNIHSMNEVELNRQMLIKSTRSIKDFCRLQGIDKQSFESEVSFSFWEYIEGTRHVVVKDSAIAGRYHIFSQRRLPTDENNYMIVENGNEILKGTRCKVDDLCQHVSEKCVLYDTVCNLPYFDSSNVPVIEMVEDENNLYFLQYLHGRKFEPNIFTLNRLPEDDEIEAHWARGATQENGLICDTRRWYGSEPDEFILAEEDASLEHHANTVFSELMTPRRKAQFVINNDFEYLAETSIDSHLTISKLFRPGISVSLSRNDLEKIVPEFAYEDNEFLKYMQRNGFNKFEDFHVKLQVTSDGRKAYIKRVE